MPIWRKIIEDEAGVAAMEYVLIVALIAIAIIATLSEAGHRLGNVLTTIAVAMDNAGR